MPQIKILDRGGEDLKELDQHKRFWDPVLNCGFYRSLLHFATIRNAEQEFINPMTSHDCL